MESDVRHQTETVPFAAPSAGSWELDLAHFSPDCSRLVRDAMELAMPKGMEDGFDLVGAPVKTLDAHFLNGRFYRRLVPLVGAGRNLPAPPNFVLKLATRVHPGFRAREKTAASAMEGRIWLDELRRWEDEWKPAMVANSRCLADIDHADLDDAALADHLLASYKHVTDGLVLHFRLHISDLGPIGLLLVRGRDWGFDSAELMQCLSGYSNATSAPAIALAKIGQALSSTPDSLDDVRAAGPDAANALDAFLAEFGNRLTGGYDFTDQTLSEMPATILAGIRASGDAAIDVAAQAVGDRTASSLRAQLPAGDQATFDQILEDARLLYGLRDENGPITYQWPAGVMRRVLLHIGERLEASGQLASAKHVFDLSADEMATILRGKATNTSALTPASIERRYDTRMSWAALDAPRLLGPEPVLPPLAVLPEALAQLMDATLTLLELIDSPISRSALAGIGIGQASYRGRARVVSDAIDALADFEPGDILVTPFTVPTMNSVLAIAGAVVTEEGGLLSHAAVIAREFGIPGVIGASGAVSAIPDGALIEVDAATGLVTVIEAVAVA